ncbi:hypothetical protein [Mycobacterium uberis]|uniref:hypothetical protein n=1 Tax=Mycobacterium uberis TaxID=2162698 RepID=UPI000E304A6A|nr:hypothetical protein [Mycobacterium uberis]
MAEVHASLNKVETKTNFDKSHIVMVGILSTLMPEHPIEDRMNDSARYAAFNESTFRSRGENIHINIAGPE